MLSGPDLTNQLVGALIRFWVGPVAFMVNIQVTVYQVIIPENQRSSLRFVWWNEGNLDSERANYEMCVHLFRAVFSLSSNNYALRKVAVDNSNCYRNDIDAVTMKNFYVNNFLKSVLVRRIQKMCSAGGFSFTEFIKNKKLVLMHISENHRREGVKDADLSNEELPTERT